MIRIVVGREPIDLAAELALVEPGAGAVATFSGHVRADADDPHGEVATLELEHYPGMTEAALHALAEDAVVRWHLQAVTIVHRVGPMGPGTRIVLVATAAPHRHAALEACAALIDRLKTDAPFWKRETRANDDRWVEMRGSDNAAADRWR